MTREQLKERALLIALEPDGVFVPNTKYKDLIAAQDAYIDELEKERTKWEALATEWHYKFFKATDKTEIMEQD